MGTADAAYDYRADTARGFLRHVRRLGRPGGGLLDWRRPSREAPLDGARVLVVGCARGGDCRYFVEFGARDVHGLDVVDDVGADFAHPSVRYHRGSAEAMDLPGDAFDFVYCSATMEHVPRIEAAFREMVRVVRPGGMIYSEAGPLWNSHEGHHRFGAFPGQPWIHLRRSREELLASSGRDGMPSTADVDFMFSGWFNREPSTRYVEVCARLPVAHLVTNKLRHDPPALLTEDVFRELEPRGYRREELLATQHRLVAVK